MNAGDQRETADALARAAERLDALAEVAELMGDEHTALRLRHDGSRCRMRAMALFDD